MLWREWFISVLWWRRWRDRAIIVTKIWYWRGRWRLWCAVVIELILNIHIVVVVVVTIIFTVSRFVAIVIGFVVDVERPISELTIIK